MIINITGMKRSLRMSIGFLNNSGSSETYSGSFVRKTQ